MVSHHNMVSPQNGDARDGPPPPLPPLATPLSEVVPLFFELAYQTTTYISLFIVEKSVALLKNVEEVAVVEEVV